MRGGFTWTSCVLCLIVTLGCGGDRRSGALRAADSTPAATPDTARAAARPDSAPALQDTASAATRAKPPKKPAAKRSAAKPATPAKPTDSSMMSAAPPESTSAAAPVQTSDASAPLRDEYHRAPLDTVSQQVYDGWKQFNLNCARCHGEDVLGTTIAPHLIVSLRPDGPINTKELFVQTVCAGRPAKGMPAWCTLGLDMDKINDIYSYVKGRSDSKIHPGRPAVKSGG